LSKVVEEFITPKESSKPILEVAPEDEPEPVPLLHFNLPIDPEPEAAESFHSVEQHSETITITEPVPSIEAKEQIVGKPEVNPETSKFEGEATAKLVSPLLAPTIESESVPLMPLTSERGWISRIFFCCTERK
jgi:hypothetical protein